MAKNLIQAYQQAPWRVQIQRIGLALLLLVTSAVVAGLYLNISARNAEIGVTIKAKEADRDAIHYQIESLNAKLAEMNAARKMEERALKLGFRRYTPEEVTYIEVAGYYGRQTVQLAPAEYGLNATPPLIKPVYTQSLGEWLLAKAVHLGSQQ